MVAQARTLHTYKGAQRLIRRVKWVVLPHVPVSIIVSVAQVLDSVTAHEPCTTDNELLALLTSDLHHTKGPLADVTAALHEAANLLRAATALKRA
jgi:hypothetical protein